MAALLWLLASPAEALSGSDVAHIIKRTCDPGGPLITMDRWKEFGTRQGEVIACRPAGESWFQIAAGAERFGKRPMHCSYFSLRNGDGADLCSPIDRAGSFVQHLMAVRADRSGRMALAGIVSDDVATVRGEPVIPIGRERAARLGARRPLAYFSVTVPLRALCADPAPRLVARDARGRRVAHVRVDTYLMWLSVTDRVPYARSLGAVCPWPEPPVSQTQLVAGVQALIRALV
jgi:hypothetical protein